MMERKRSYKCQDRKGRCSSTCKGVLKCKSIQCQALSVGPLLHPRGTEGKSWDLKPEPAGLQRASGGESGSIDESMLHIEEAYYLSIIKTEL